MPKSLVSVTAGLCILGAVYVLKGAPQSERDEISIKTQMLVKQICSSYPPGTAFRVEDLDGDGDADVEVRRPDGAVCYYRNDPVSFTWIVPPEHRQALGPWMISPEPQVPTGGGQIFRDETSTRLPEIYDISRASAAGDVDGDGDLDIFVANSDFGPSFSGQNRLLINDGNGFFTDETELRIPQTNSFSTDVEIRDFDADGDLDIFVARASLAIEDTHEYLINDGNGFFTDQGPERLPRRLPRALTISVGDIDSDGDADVFMGNSHQDPRQVLLNDGSGSFVRCNRCFPDTVMSVESSGIGDVNNDGHLDLYLGVSDYHNLPQGGQDRLWINDGRGKFRDESYERMPRDTSITASVAIGDLDNDGWLDVFITTLGHSLFRNHGGGVFQDETTSKLPSLQYLRRIDVAKLADLDGDGDLDIAIGDRPAEQNWYYENDGTGVFVDVTSERFPRLLDSTNDFTIADYDEDGDLDIFIAEVGDLQNRIWINYSDATAVKPDAPRGNGIKDHVVSVYPNPLVSGASGTNSKVTIYLVAAVSQTIEVSLYDVLGRVQGRKVVSDLTVGEHRLFLELDMLISTGVSSGVYFLRVAFEGSAEVRRLLVFR